MWYGFHAVVEVSGSLFIVTFYHVRTRNKRLTGNGVVPILETSYIDVKSELTEELHERKHNEICTLVNDDDVNKR